MKWLRQMQLKARSKKQMKIQPHLIRKAAVAAAIARAKAKKAAAQGETVATNEIESTVEKIDENPTALDPKKPL